MNAKHFEPINVHTRQSQRAKVCGDTTRLIARWQSGLEARPGYGLRKLHLEFAPSKSQAITNSNL